MRRLLEFNVNGVQYRADTMSARIQFHVARRLSAMAAAPLELIGSSEKQDPVKIAAAALTALSTLPDSEADYVINACLANVRRKDNGTWVSILKDGVDLYDLPLADMAMVVWHVLKGNLEGFFDALPPELREQVKAGIGSVSQTESPGSSAQPSVE